MSLGSVLAGGSTFPRGGGQGPEVPGDPVRMRFVLTDGFDSPGAQGRKHGLSGVTLLDLGTEDHAVTLHADTIAKGPRRVGFVTFRSFPELIVSNARVDVRPHGAPGERGERQRPSPDLFAVLRTALDPIHELVREGETRPVAHSRRLLLDGFPVSRIAIQDLTLALSVPPRRSAQLVASEVVLLSKAATALAFRQLRIRAANGGVLTAAEATWQSGVGLVVAGSYDLTHGGRSIRSAAGRFRFSVDGSLALLGRTTVASRAHAALQGGPSARSLRSRNPLRGPGPGPSPGTLIMPSDPLDAVLRQAAFGPETMLGDLPALTFLRLLCPGTRMRLVEPCRGQVQLSPGSLGHRDRGVEWKVGERAIRK